MTGSACDVCPPVFSPQGGSLDRACAATFGAGGVARCKVPERWSLPRSVSGPVVCVVHLREFQFSPRWSATFLEEFEREVKLVPSVEVEVFTGNVGTLGYDDCVSDRFSDVVSQKRQSTYAWHVLLECECV